MAEDVAKQLGEKATAENIMGVMIESHLVAGTSFILLSLLFDDGPLTVKLSRQASSRSPPSDQLALPTANPSRMPSLPLFFFPPASS